MVQNFHMKEEVATQNGLDLSVIELRIRLANRVTLDEYLTLTSSDSLEVFHAGMQILHGRIFVG